MTTILDRIVEVYDKKLPFVVYRKPNLNTISGFFQKTDSLHFVNDFNEAGFVFAPFNQEEKAILIPERQSEKITETYIEEDFINTEGDYIDDVTSKKSHILIVEKAIREIQNKEFKKVVISRKEQVKVDSFSVREIYERLLHKYNNAFVYVWFHPKVGLWLGATPETLLNIKENHYKTMSLAGTQVYKNTENIIWKDKEIEEQQLVTDFIASQLSEISTNLTIGNSETVKAGSLLHLKTKISGKLIEEKSNLKNLIQALHPTPAVCGLPREQTKSFILKHEDYQRTFYTGFLGELNLDDSSELYVNLRCMEVVDELIYVYVGGGITKDSNPEKEWEETVAKSKIMKSVL